MAEIPIRAATLPTTGDMVWIRQQRWRVERALRDRDAVCVDVVAGRRRRTFLIPFDTVTRAAGGTSRQSRTVRSQHALAWAAGALARATDLRLPLTAVDAAIEILPHQFEPWLAIHAGHVRLLLADEVGLGKTIEAGLVIAELVQRYAAPRILVLAPSLLIDQWRSELRRRFGLETLQGNRAGLEGIARAVAFGVNPWHRSGVWVASADFLKQPPVLNSLPRDPWDLLVIDEAHAVCGDSERYEACHAIARRSRRVILLTATPHSGDQSRFDRLRALGELSANDNRPVIFRRTRRSLGYPHTRNVRWHGVTLDRSEHHVLLGLDEFERTVRRAAADRHADAAQLLLSVFRKRALSTFAALSRSISRRLAWLADEPFAESWRQPGLGFDADIDEEPSDFTGLEAHTGLDPQAERSWLRGLLESSDLAAARDSKIVRLQSLIARTAEPVVVFSEFRDSLLAIQRRLRTSRAVSLIHGGQSLTERTAELRRYLRGPASILLATDVAGQGLNLQSRGRWVVSLELPWNPVRLEQRIGRVDRLGQSRRPHFTVLIARHEAEDGLLHHLARRVLLARRTLADDVLADVLPPERETQHSISPDAGVDKRCAWRRAARVVAKACLERRKLAACWRGPRQQAGRTLVAAVPAIRKLIPEQNVLILCFVPLLNGQGELIERIPLALLAPQERGTDGLQSFAEIATRRRLNKVARWLDRTARRQAGRELALLQAIREEARTRPAQPGLFDNRAQRQLDAAVHDDERLEGDGLARWTALVENPRPSLGPIEVEVILRPRR